MLSKEPPDLPGRHNPRPGTEDPPLTTAAATRAAAPESPLVVETESSDGVTVVRFRAVRIYSDAHSHAMGLGLHSALDSAGPKPRLVVDLQGVQLLSSAAIAKLLLYRRRAKDRGGELRLCRPTPHVSRTFDLTNLTTFFSIDNSLETALVAFE